MKDQYSSGYDDPVIANERFKNKLDFLERQSIKRENYLKDLERNFKLSKQTIKSLTEKNPARDQIIAQLHQENSLLMHKLRQEYDGICRLNALYLMECQLRIEETKSYNQRIKDFQETMAELRRYLHDKEESFSFVAQKLKRLQELEPNQQLSMYQKLVNYSAIVKEEIRWKDVFNQVLEDRDAWKKIAEESKEKCKRLQIIIQGIKAEPDFAKFETFVNSLHEDQSNKAYTAIVSNKNTLSVEHEAKHHANLSTNLTYSEGKKLPIQPNVELIRLMKKEKLSNKILDVALSQALDKNFQLIEYNKRLIQNNQTLRKQVDYIIADMVVLCEALTQYDYNYRTKLRLLKHRAKSDIDIPSYKEIINKYKNNDLSEAQEILFTKMRNDVEELTEYIAFCPLQKTNQIPSYESPRKMYRDQEKFQISMNGKELEISEI